MRDKKVAMVTMAVAMAMVDNLVATVTIIVEMGVVAIKEEFVL